MEKRINRQLLLMGFLTAFLSLILCTTIFLTVYEKQVKASLQTNLDLVVSTYNSVGNFDFLSSYSTDSTFRVVITDAEETVILDTFQNAAFDIHVDFQRIRNEGVAQGEYFSDERSETIYYSAQIVDDSRIVLCSVPATVIYDYLKSASIYLLLIFVIVLVLSIWLSAMLTDRLITPVRIIAENPDHPKLLDENEDTIYPELIPIVHELRLRRNELRQKAKEIEMQHRRLTTVLAQMEEGLLLLDGSGRVITANASAASYLHIESGHEGKGFLSICTEPVLCEAIITAFSGKRSAVDYSVDGRLLRVMTDPVLHQSAVMGVVCLFVDVTERREMERMKQEFTSNVSHELKTPLTSISGYAELIENGMVRTEDLPRFAGLIRKESSRLLLLIADILSLSEIEETGSVLNKEEMDLFAVAQLTIKRLKPIADQHSVSLVLEGLHSEIHADPAMVSHLCYNLIDNAIRYNRRGGNVIITIGEHRITVADTGIGIPDEHKSRVFERFYRVDKSRSKQTGGTGLGLAIVKHIADVHGATLTLDSTENEGTTICVVFPE